MRACFWPGRPAWQESSSFYRISEPNADVRSCNRPSAVSPDLPRTPYVGRGKVCDGRDRNSLGGWLDFYVTGTDAWGGHKGVTISMAVNPTLFPTGSLPRPAWVLDIILDRKADRISENDAAPLLDRAIESSIALQERAGLDEITDGEWRRESYVKVFAERVRGFEPDLNLSSIPYPAVVAPIEYQVGSGQTEARQLISHFLRLGRCSRRWEDRLESTARAGPKTPLSTSVWTAIGRSLRRPTPTSMKPTTVGCARWWKKPWIVFSSVASIATVLPASSVRIAPGSICCLAIQTYGDQLNFHPHLHSLVAEGGWGRDEGTFQSVSWLNSDILSAIFRQQVLEMMVQKRRLSTAFAHKISHWRHSGGFQVYCSQTVKTDDRQALERLAAYILRPSFAATRLRYQPATGQVHYRTAKSVARSMDALDWIAQVISHIPDPGTQMVRYYGCYSNASRGKRRLAGPAAAAKASSHEPETEADGFSRARQQNWARLLRKIYEVDPLTCPRCLAPHRPDSLLSSWTSSWPPFLQSRPARSSSPPIPSSGTTCPPGRIPETYAPGIDALLGVRLDLPSFRCLVAALVSLPHASLLTSQNTRYPGPHGPLLAHLDAHFSTCYPQLEKQIPILLSSQALSVPDQPYYQLLNKKTSTEIKGFKLPYWTKIL